MRKCRKKYGFERGLYKKILDGGELTVLEMFHKEGRDLKTKRLRKNRGSYHLKEYCILIKKDSHLTQTISKKISTQTKNWIGKMKDVPES